MADEPKWTPGPWEMRRDGVVTESGDNNRFRFIPIISPWREDAFFEAGEVGHDTAKANARLIAAAPDLYEALNALDKYGHTDAVWRHAKAALAKARGETNGQ